MDGISSTHLIYGCICLYFSCTLASSGGLGGGGLNVPILLVVFGLSYKNAVILSLCTVLGNYIAQSSINIKKAHPQVTNRPLIYWDAVLVFLPAQLGGANIGVVFQAIFPETGLLIISMAVVLYACFKTTRKGISLANKESADLGNWLLLESSETNKVEPSYQDSNTNQLALDAYLSSVISARPTASSMRVNQDEDSIRLFSNSFSTHGGPPTGVKYDFKAIGALAMLWFTYAAIYVSLQVATETCSPAYFSLLGGIYVPIALTIFFGVRYIKGKQENDYVYDGDINFAKLGFLPPVGAFIVGILCSLLGIGGGELMGPLLLTLGVFPQVTSATISMMSLLNSSSTILHYCILGQVNYQLAAITFSCGLLGGLTGRSWALWMTEKFKRPSITTFMLASVLMLSLCLLIYDVASNDRDWGFHPYCK